jgi:uncharacterized protein (DUF1800 family)
MSMTLDPKGKAAFALHRFGLGPKAGTILAIEADPRAALLADLDQADSARFPATDLLASGEAAREAFQFNLKLREARRAARAQAAELARAGGATTNQSSQADAVPSANRAATGQTAPVVSLPQQIYRQEAQARTEAALNAEIGFLERLTWFWSNHFCVSIIGVRWFEEQGAVSDCGAYVFRLKILGSI